MLGCLEEKTPPKDQVKIAKLFPKDGVGIAFVSKFKTHYIRNNRGSGKKNIRCFPACSSELHVNRGFCGNKIHVKIKNLAAEGTVLLQIRPRVTT